MSLIEQLLLDRYEGSKKEHLDELVGDIRGVESSGGTMLVNPHSTARGDFQFLTKEGDGQNAFQTAINRYENTLSAMGHEIPSWVSEARSHNNPMGLSYDQQKDLMLANIYQQKGSDALFSKALSGDVDAGKQLYYKYHHTNPDEATREVANKYFQEVPGVAQVSEVLPVNQGGFLGSNTAVPRVSSGSNIPDPNQVSQVLNLNQPQVQEAAEVGVPTTSAVPPKPISWFDKLINSLFGD
jgi:hypothetical protein